MAVVLDGVGRGRGAAHDAAAALREQSILVVVVAKREMCLEWRCLPLLSLPFLLRKKEELGWPK
jgi:hypothetical protein